MDVSPGQWKGKAFEAFALAITLSILGSPVWSHVLAAGTKVVGSKIVFQIPAGTLTNAIHELGHQARISVYYGSTTEALDPDKVTTRAVVGAFELAEALKRMLEGTGLTFRFASDREVLIEPVKKAATVPRTLPPAHLQAVADHGEAWKPAELQEVLVTGSLIRGLDSITAPVMVLGEREKKQAAYGTVQDVLRTLPQTFGGGPDEDFSPGQNFSRGVGVNLRGLGTGATLVLVNGRRQPASGLQGDFVDVSTIPWSVVKRIEVLTDGASALYGSDAIAGVINIIMRDDLSGFGETQVHAGETVSGASERLFSQSLAHHWDMGRWFLAYQYSQRTALAAADRTYASNADKRSFGGSDRRTVFSNPGNILSPDMQLPAFGIPEGQDGRALSVGQLLPGVKNLYNQMEMQDLFPNKRTHSVFFTASQKLTTSLELFGEARYNERLMDATDRPFGGIFLVPSSNPFYVNPFKNVPFVLVAYNFVDDFGPLKENSKTRTWVGTAGIKANLGSEWQATLSSTYGKETMDWAGYNQADPEILAARLADPNADTALNPFGYGSNTNPETLSALKYVQIENADSDIDSVNFIVDGPLPATSRGIPKLAVGFDARKESLSRQETGYSDQYQRKVGGVFAELSLPIGSLELSAAGRYEKYSDFGSTFNPKFGMRWRASDSVRLRGSWGISFRAPTLVDLYDQSLDYSFLLPIPDPHSSRGFSNVLIDGWSNPHLREETAKTWTAGVDLAPTSVPGLAASFTYYRIDYTNRIFHYPLMLPLTEALADDAWSALVIRNPSRAAVDAICRGTKFFGSVIDCLASMPNIILDLRGRNLSATVVDGIDLEAKQLLRTEYGSFGLQLTGSYMLGFNQTLTHTAPTVDFAGALLNPPRLRLRSVAEWNPHGRDRPGFGIGIAWEYLSSFRDDASPTLPQVDSSTTFDVQLNYRTAKSFTWLGNIQIFLNAKNIFNTAPPFVDRQEGYDPTNSKPYGRVISFSIQKNL